MINCNLTSNGYFAPPGGYPFRLYVGQETAAGFIPKGIVTVIAAVKPDYVADVHLAIYTAPMTSGGDDGALVLQVDALATTSKGATLTLTIPASTSLVPIAPAEYIVRLWYDNALGGTADEVARDTTITDTSTQALIPFGVVVSSFTVS